MLKDRGELNKARRFAISFNLAMPTHRTLGLSNASASRTGSTKGIDDYYSTYKGVRRYLDEFPGQAREHGYVLSLYVRIRPARPASTERNAIFVAR